MHSLKAVKENGKWLVKTTFAMNDDQNVVICEINNKLAESAAEECAYLFAASHELEQSLSVLQDKAVAHAKSMTNTYCEEDWYKIKYTFPDLVEARMALNKAYKRY